MALNEALRNTATGRDGALCGKGACHVRFRDLRPRTRPAPAVDPAAPGATVVLIGIDPAPLPLTTEDVVRRQFVLRGSMILDHPHDFAEAVAELRLGGPYA